MTFTDLFTPDRWRFDGGHPARVAMLEAAHEFVRQLATAGPQRRIAFLGRSGNGKTHLAAAIARNVECLPGYAWSITVHWPQALERMRSGHTSASRLLEDWGNHPGLLVLDEIGMGNDLRDYGLDKLITLLESRRDRPLVVTSNLLPTELDRVDARLLSRLYRHGGMVIECTAPDYNAPAGNNSRHVSGDTK